MARLLGLDIGTSGCKAVVIDASGRVLSHASASYPSSRPHPLWSEQEPEDWWLGVQHCLDETGLEVDAIGVTGQMHGAVFLDGNGDVVRPALLWNDQRTAAECEEIELRVGSARIRELTGNAPMTGLQLPKLLWVRRHEPELWARVRHVLLPKDFIVYRLTGEMVGDVADSSGSGAFELKERRWSSEILDACELDSALFPPIGEPGTVCATTRGGLQVYPAGGDQAASGVGVGAVRPGILSLALGSSGVVYSSGGRTAFSEPGVVNTFCDCTGNWLTMGVTLNCGTAIDAFRAEALPGEPFETFERMAAACSEPGEALFLPYMSGERCPFQATDFAHGIEGEGSLEETCRAALDGVSANLALVYRCLEQTGVRADELRVTGGGARSEVWLQTLADIMGMPMRRVEGDEGPAFGSALIAGVGLGVWPSAMEAADATVRLAEAVTRRHDRSQAVERLLGSIARASNGDARTSHLFS